MNIKELINAMKEYDNLESLSFSNSILPTSFEEEFFILSLS
mgnify:CR=1 FL=1